MSIGFNNFFLATLFLSMTGAPLMAQQPAPKQEPKTLEKNVLIRATCNYLLYLPPEYGRDKDKKWPLIMFLHGSGESGNNLEQVKRHGVPKIVEEVDNFPFIVVSPQCPANSWWDDLVLLALLDDMVQQYAVDTERIYLTGLSMGGFGTWSLAIRAPQIFAAIAPICGGGNPYIAGRLRDVPVWAFHGAMDSTVPSSESRRMVRAVKNAGGDAKLTIYPNAGHDAWTETYNNPELYNWFLQHRRERPERPTTTQPVADTSPDRE